MKIIADDKIPFLKGVLEPFANVIYLPPSQISSEAVKDADALLIRTRTKCNADLLEKSSVKFIATATIGYDHIDTDYCERKGIIWVNAPGCNSSSVQQYVASALVTLAKQKKFSLETKTIGIVGIGNVGSKVDRIAKIFGMRTLLNDPPRERKEGKKDFVSLDELIDKSDIISLHVPLNTNGIDRTFHLANKSFFEKFREEKIFINTSRGEVADTIALKQAIKENKISACVLDVWENEPQIDEELLNLTDIATPHIAGYSVEGKANGTAACVNALCEYFELGLGNWYPKNLPSPNKEEDVRLNCSMKPASEVFYECVIATYNILDDDHKLRNTIDEFEKLRADYPVRREFNYYNVHLKNANELLKKAIRELGFNIKK